MTFRVEPDDLRAYAAQLAEARQAARAYVAKWGGFSAHEKGLLGMVFPQHAD